jgi:hypothetical protein
VTSQGTLAELIDRLGDGIYSWTWSVDEDTRRRAANDLRAWAAAEFGPLDAPREGYGEIRYRAYDVPEVPTP